MEKAYFAAGCFWHVQEEFDKTPGLISSVVGYSGGKTKNPTYEEVSSHKTEHAETVEVVFNEKIISFEELVSVFFLIHDPTQLNRQGPDIGDNYRSAIFYLNIKQKKTALRIIKEEEKKIGKTVVTAVSKLKAFYPAEEYHQKYFEKRK